jgi:hypothetical protein
MRPLIIVKDYIGIQIGLQVFKVAINLFPKSNPVKLIQNRLVKTLSGQNP